jgi:hypothetical protein
MPPETISKPKVLAEILTEELFHIKGEKLPDKEPLGKVFKQLHDQNLSALCFSGGGIRSATFGLGIIQALAKHNLLTKFDYLSTVSGGGYLGSWLSAWIKRKQDELAAAKVGKVVDGNLYTQADADAERQKSSSFGIEDIQRRLNSSDKFADNKPNPEPREITRLREYSNYMSPKVGILSADSWTLLAIYLRNLFLNSTVSVPIIAAVLLLPRMFLSITNRQVPDNISITALILSVIAGGVAVGFITKKRPSKIKDAEKEKYATDIWVVGFAIIPLIVSAFSATTFWTWFISSDKKLFDGFIYSNNSYNIYFFFIFSLAIYLLGTFFFSLAGIIFRNGFYLSVKEFLSGCAVSSVGGFLLWLTAKNLPVINSDLYVCLYVCFAVPVFLMLFLLAATFFVGLTSKFFIKDPDREWLARFGAWILIICLFWIVLNALVLFGTKGFEAVIDKIIDGTMSTASITAKISALVPIVSGIISLFGGFSEKSKVKDEVPKDFLSRALKFAPIAGVVFLGSLFIGLASLTAFILKHSLPFFTETFDFLKPVSGIESLCYLGIWFALLSACGIWMGGFVNINKFSLHSTYRNRLIRAYLGASRPMRNANLFTGFDDDDNLLLDSLKGQKPFHIVNGTLNLVSSANLAWQNRKAASFSMSPLHCGSSILGYRKTVEYAKSPNSGNSIRLGTAMAISGAAANPNMGYISSPILTFVMTLFNIRLGWWLGNTGTRGDDEDLRGRKFFEKSSPTMAPLPLLNELLGRTDENKRYINLSDGGHFENLGIYEMIMRRCKFIVLSDAAADGNFTFGEISNAIEKCKVDLGVNIVFENGLPLFSREDAEANEITRMRFAVADIIYPEKDGDNHLTGTLLYIRPTFYGKEPTNVFHYAAENPTFPHQSTADQQYDEHQFEAYRTLGFFIMNELLENNDANGLKPFFDSLKNS